MLNLYGYNSNELNGRRLHKRCLSQIKEKRLSIFDGGCCSDEEQFSVIISGADGSSLFVIKNDDRFENIRKRIDDAEGNSYTVLVLDSFEDMYGIVRPSFRPSGILLENADEEHIGSLLRDIYEDYTRYISSISVSSTPVQTPVPSYRFRIRFEDFTESFDNIYMIEVQSKRITFHTVSQSYEFYDSLDAIMKEAPEYFVRVHRSYVINVRFIKSIDYHERVILMNDGSEVFFSRNYSSDLKKCYVSNLYGGESS
ncbi:LytTR family DNA-binding domain-containing protein [Ruminococcus sp. HUN007]|uniref:LytR/AlgR family response regulator transcription factor n=1 Tax=Ruminococcus sp. HUN007 TaxID=1514668 RepID=UPI0005D2C5AF|nr:LytTR family DNA-binding domain-containing protein [Ruminococcus sp. HUN007]